jgi:hypothetical protein
MLIWSLGFEFRTSHASPRINSQGDRSELAQDACSRVGREDRGAGTRFRAGVLRACLKSPDSCTRPDRSPAIIVRPPGATAQLDMAPTPAKAAISSPLYESLTRTVRSFDAERAQRPSKAYKFVSGRLTLAGRIEQTRSKLIDREVVYKMHEGIFIALRQTVLASGLTDIEK